MTFDYHRPKTLQEAWRLADADAEARFVAGGTDVMVRIREGKIAPSSLVSLSGIAELAQVELGPPLVLGAGLRVTDLQEHPLTPRAPWPGLRARGDGWWSWPAGSPRLPLLYSLRAVHDVPDGC